MTNFLFPPDHLWRMPDLRVVRRLQVMLAVLWHREFAGRIGVPIPRPVRSPQSLRINFSLQSHEGLDQGLWPWGTARNVHIDRQVAVDAFENIVSLLERPARNGASAHRGNILRLRCLIQKTTHLRPQF